MSPIHTATGGAEGAGHRGKQLAALFRIAVAAGDVEVAGTGGLRFVDEPEADFGARQDRVAEAIRCNHRHGHAVGAIRAHRDREVTVLGDFDVATARIDRQRVHDRLGDFQIVEAAVRDHDRALDLDRIADAVVDVVVGTVRGEPDDVGRRIAAADERGTADACRGAKVDLGAGDRGTTRIDARAGAR